MLDYYLKFSSQEEAFAALKDAGYTSADEEGKEFIISATHQYCVDEVGTIYKGGKWEPNESGEMITIEEPVKLDDWHINVRILSGDIAETLKDFVIDNPKTPYRIFG
jgi:autonomous glycyl radical cofactor GrcA